MSPEDRMAIEALYARYSHAIDLGEPGAYAACFAPGGAIGLAGEPLTSGDDALEAMARASRARGTIRHWIANLVIDGDGARATGSCYLVLLDVAQRPPAILHTGIYADEIVKVDGHWRFWRRVHTRDTQRENV